MDNHSKYSEHTRLGWGLGILAIFFGLGIGLTYVFSSDKYDQTFGILTIMEGGFALTGLLLIDVINGKQLQIKPDYFKPPETSTLKRTIFILGALSILQIIMQFPLSVRDWHRALAIMFAGPAEELFFRGLMLSPFVRLGKNDTKLKIKNLFGGGYILEVSPTELLGIFISSMAFMMLHINYYGDKKLLVTVFLSGVILGLFYLKYKDLTANILAHFALNFIVVLQSFWMIGF